MMNKIFLYLLIYLMLVCPVCCAYEVPTRNDYRYTSGVYVNMSKRNTAEHLYKDSHEWNKAHKDMYLCLVTKGQDIGYLVHRSSFGALGYVYDTDYYMLMERRRCSARYDTYPVVHSWQQAKDFNY